MKGTGNELNIVWVEKKVFTSITVRVLFHMYLFNSVLVVLGLSGSIWDLRLSGSVVPPCGAFSS